MYKRQVHGVCYRWDVPKRLLQVIKPSEVAPSGEFLTDELNLLSVGFCGETGDFATRLYPYGKEDRESGQVLNIASVNEGLEYVEDHSYSDKVISACYRDKDCEDPQELKDRRMPLNVSMEMLITRNSESSRMITCNMPYIPFFRKTNSDRAIS